MKTLTYEFKVSEVLIRDSSEWMPLKILRDTHKFEIFRPFSDSVSVSMPLAFGGQVTPMEYSLMRARVEIEDGQPEPEWMPVYMLVKNCLSWVRVATRQYWIGMLPSPSMNFPKATIQTEVDGVATFTGAGAYSAAVVPLALTRSVWDGLAPVLEQDFSPRVSESFLCDALLYFAERNYAQAAVGFGIACELELNSFITDLLSLQPEQVKDVYKLSGLRFSEKLSKVPGLLGASTFRDSKPVAAEKLSELYEMRGQAVHSGAAVLRQKGGTGKQAPTPAPVTGAALAGFWFAAEDFFEWTRRERTRMGIWASTGSVYDALDTQRSNMLSCG